MRETRPVTDDNQEISLSVIGSVPTGVVFFMSLGPTGDIQAESMPAVTAAKFAGINVHQYDQQGKI